MVEEASLLMVLSYCRIWSMVTIFYGIGQIGGGVNERNEIAVDENSCKIISALAYLQIIKNKNGDVCLKLHLIKELR
jgi:hypothetical protein